MAKVRKTNPEHVHFLTLTVVGWTDVFIRQPYNEIIMENLNFCIERRNLELYAFCLMTNHLHMIVGSDPDTPFTETIKNFKSYSAKRILTFIEANWKESRREFLLKRFAYYANIRAQDAKRQFWERDNYPEAIFSDSFFSQKKRYIENNPVKAGFVLRPEDWANSSANPDFPLRLTSWDGI